MGFLFYVFKLTEWLIVPVIETNLLPHLVQCLAV